MSDDDEPIHNFSDDHSSILMDDPNDLPKYNPALVSHRSCDGMDESQQLILKLVLAQPLTLYSFPDTVFTVYVSLADQYLQPYLPTPPEEPVSLSIQLLHADTKREASPGVLQIEDDLPLMIGPEGTCEIQLKIAEESRGTGGIAAVLRKFVFRIIPLNRPDLEELITGPMTIVRNRLEVRPNPSRPLPKDWFKDEGGRENCVEMHVHLLDRAGMEVSNRRVKLRLILLYENLDKVQNQEILKLSPDCKMAIDEDGKATLKLRIEEVSKNHQRQAFRIKVEPDTEDNPTAVDISADVSPPISVFSKRIRKKCKKVKEDTEPSGGILNVANGAAAAINRYCGLGEKVNEPVFIGESQVHGARSGPKGEVWESAGGTVHDILNAISNGHQEQLSGAWSALDLMAEASTGPALYNALKSVIQWTGTVVSGLTVMQWQQLGFEIKPDGNPDYSRPLYKMENPNSIIDTIIRQYAHETMQNLLVLLKHVEAGGHNYQPDAPEPNGSMPRHMETDDFQRLSKRSRTMDNARRSSYDGLRLQGGIQPRMHPHMDNPGGGGNFDLKEAASMIGRNQSRPVPNSRSPSYQTNGGPMNGGFPEHISWDTGNNGHQVVGVRRREDEIVNHASPSPPLPPTFHPQNSFMWSENGLGNPPLLSQKSMQVLFDKNNNMDPPSRTQPHQDVERHVYYILAKNFNTKRLGMLGLPAYDSQRILIGFYNVVEGHGGESRMILSPVERIHGTKEELQAATVVLQEERERGSHSVFDLQQHFMSLEKMKEAAGTYYWKKMSKMERG